MAEVQKQQALTQEKVSIEQAKSQFEIQRMQTEAQIKRELMAEEFNYNIQLAQAQMGATKAKEQEIEDRKDQRIKLQGTQQSELINQRQTEGLPKNFESSGNDVLGGFGLEEFGPSHQTHPTPVSYTHLRAHETVLDLVCRLLLEKKKKK